MSSYSLRSLRQGRPSVTSARSSARPSSSHGRLVQDVDDDYYDYHSRRPQTASTRSSFTRTSPSYYDDDEDDDDYDYRTRRPHTRASCSRTSQAYYYDDDDDRYLTSSSRRSRGYYDDDSQRYRSSYHGGSSHAGQLQAQKQTFRSAQASKQMVLEVFQNCITMLEEMESREMRREGRRAMARSDIHLPSQAGHDDKTIQRKLDTQLLLLQSQIQGCDADIRDEVKDEMADSTLEWSSGRQDRGLPHGQTDKYAGKLLEVVQTGKTKHPKVFSKPPTIGERGMRDAMQAIVIGNHRRGKLDDEYRAQSDKRAAKLRLRPGSGVTGGAERMLEVRPDLHRGLYKYKERSLR